MKAKLKDYQFSVVYCACMVAILLARHTVDRTNAEVNWSAAKMSENLNRLPLSGSASFYVDADGLQHGMSIFQKLLNRRGLLVVPTGYDIKVVRDFFDLEGAQRTVKVKFLGGQ